MKLLGILLLAHDLSRVRKLCLRNQPCVFNRQKHCQPITLCLGILIQLVKIIPSLWCSNPNCVPCMVRKSRPDNLGKDITWLLAIFIKHHAPERYSSQAVWIVCPIKPNPTTVWIINPQLCFVKLYLWNWPSVILYQIPRHVLCLSVCWSDVCISAIGIFQRVSLQVIQTRYRLSGSSVKN